MALSAAPALQHGLLRIVSCASIPAAQAKEAFKRLNLAWIEHYFTVTAVDEAILNNPEHKVLAKGGDLFFALYEDTLVGVCAMVPQERGVVELEKLAVDFSMQGKGLGKRLIKAAIAWAKERGYHTVRLSSNSTLKPAIHLYEQLGFRHAPELLADYAAYQRVDVVMLLQL